MGPKISIITICYNSASHIEDAILSVLSQKYDNKEYIIIDGGSTDGTLEIIKKYKDSIAYFVSEKDKGISDAFNKGIRAAKGDIIGICNSDDMLADDVLQRIAVEYEPGIDIYRLNEKIKNFETGEELLLIPTLEIPRVPYNAQPCHFGCYISKEAFKKYGLYDETIRTCMDLDLLRRFTYMNATYKYIPIVCGYFRKGGASACSEVKLRNDRRRIILKYGGSNIDVFKFLTYHWVKEKIKIFLNLFGDNLATKIKYRRNG